MSGSEPFRLLQRLGIDRSSVDVLPLLPLIEVAWADGEIAPRERAFVLRAAKDRKLGEDGALLLAGWLDCEPTPHYLHAGLMALSWFAKNADSGLPATAVAQVFKQARAVASSDGGWLGFRAICSQERRSLDRIERVLVDGLHPIGPAPEPPADFVARPPAVTLVEEMAERDPSPAVLVPEFANHQRARISADGSVLGQDAHALCRRKGDRDLAKQHARILRVGSRWIVESVDGPVWVNGEHTVRRRLLGGEFVRLSPASAMWFRLLTPVSSAAVVSSRR